MRAAHTDGIGKPFHYPELGVTWSSEAIGQTALRTALGSCAQAQSSGASETPLNDTNVSPGRSLLFVGFYG
jgi:hypothetical protein